MFRSLPIDKTTINVLTTYVHDVYQAVQIYSQIH